MRVLTALVLNSFQLIMYLQSKQGQSANTTTAWGGLVRVRSSNCRWTFLLLLISSLHFLRIGRTDSFRRAFGLVKLRTVHPLVRASWLPSKPSKPLFPRPASATHAPIVARVSVRA